jgi:hypothetical protein
MAGEAVGGQAGRRGPSAPRAALCYRRAMNPTTRKPHISPVFAAFGALVLLAAAAGCSQEGRTVQAVLPVQGVAWDATSATATTDTLGTTSVLATVKFKLQTTFANGCEARGGLELRTEGSTTEPLFVITPVARYTADEPCNVGLSGDTLQTLTVANLRLDSPRSSIADSIARFEVRGFGTPPIRFDVNVNVASSGDTVTTYVIEVEDKDTGGAAAGALVRVERLGTADVLSEGAADANGRYVFNVPCAGTAGSSADPYVVKVTHATRITILSVPLPHGALCKRREFVIVRV